MEQLLKFGNRSHRFALTAAYGSYHQPPEPEDLSAIFGTPDLGLSRATHMTAGESLRITSTLSADVIAFHKTMKDLVVRSRLPNPISARALSHPARLSSCASPPLLAWALR